MSYENLGYKIKMLRKVRGLSQDKLAEKTNLTQQHISRIETGITYPGVSTLAKIAKVLNIQIDELVDEELKTQEDKYIFDIMKKLEFLGIEDKNKVAGYIERILDENGIDLIKIK